MAAKPKKSRKRRLFRWTLALLAVAIAVIVALSFHQPPMRLMPTPEIFRQSGSAIFATANERSRDTGIEVFYATNRLAVGPRTNRLYAVTPGRDLALGIGTIQVGDRATTWEQVYALSTGTSDDPRPWLRLQAMHELGAVRPEQSPFADATLSAGTRGWLALVNAALDRSPDNDLIVYVHGANSTVERAVGQAAQLRHFTGGHGVVVLFAWPTAENFLRYPADLVTAYGAAPQLARLVELLAAHTRARRIDVLTYSAGGMVGSGGMAIVGRDAARPGALNPRLGEVYYAAPDADFREFVDDLKDYAGVPQRVTVAANMHDSALRLSQLINRASRAGRPDLNELSADASTALLSATHMPGFDVIQIRPGDIPGLSRTSHTFWYDDPWVSTDVLITLLFDLAPEARGLAPYTAPAGARYYAFPPDYPDRLPGVMATIRGGTSMPLP